jgi:hypothetical protein
LAVISIEVVLEIADRGAQLHQSRRRALVLKRATDGAHGSEYSTGGGRRVSRSVHGGLAALSATVAFILARIVGSPALALSAIIALIGARVPVVGV